MGLILKELLIVLVIGFAVFKLSRPIALTFTSEADFSRRRNTWMALTIIAFLSPSFWLFVLLALPILIVVGRKDTNPAALYLLLLNVVPPVSLPLPIPGMPSLFNMNNYLLLSFCIMTPAAIRIYKSKAARNRNIRSIDWMVLGYGLLNSVQYLHVTAPGGGIYPTTVTDCMRRAFVFIFITYIPYYVISRSNANRRDLVDSLASYCLAGAVLAGIAIFESAKQWLLFGEMPGRWGDTTGVEYLVREHALRAMASTGHPLSLATLLVIACGFWFYLQSRVPSARRRMFASVILWGGVLTTYSRGPWIGAAGTYLMYILLRGRAITTMMKTLGGIVVMGAVLSLTPLAGRIINIMPFLGGKTDIGSFVYRQRLLDRSWEIIENHLLLGDPSALLEMQDLRQGEGIIDLVNMYIQVLLNDGFIGLSLLLGILLIGFAKANALRRKLVHSDPDMALLGVTLMSAIFGFFVLMAGVALDIGTERMYYVLGALTAAFVAIGTSAPVAPGRPIQRMISNRRVS
jgi:O-Antigen ligase